MSNCSMISVNTIKWSTNCNKKERGIISSSNVLQLNSAQCRKTEQYIQLIAGKTNKL